MYLRWALCTAGYCLYFCGIAALFCLPAHGHSVCNGKVVIGLFSVGIWARDEELYKILSSKTAQAELRRGRHPAEFTGRKLDLLVAAPDAVGWAGAGAVDCSTVLIHGAAGPLARSLRTGCAVSYGTSPKDTLTFSSLEGDQICLALQRELVTLAGDIVERQELVLPFPVGQDPLLFLSVAGTLLLLGVPAEALDLR